MWLVRIDEYTGYVDNHDVSKDGWKSVSSFRKVVDIYGLAGFTCIALYVDYLSPFRNYIKSERWKKCLDEIYGNMDELDEDDPLISEAIDKYTEIQFNSSMSRDQLNNEISMTLVSRLREAYEENDQTKIIDINKQIKIQDESTKEFKKTFNLDEMIKNYGVTENGYELSRIELDLEQRRHSKFKNGGKNLKNPNKLNLSDDIEQSVGSATKRGKR